MVKLDGLLHSSSLSRVNVFNTKRKQSNKAFRVDDGEAETAPDPDLSIREYSQASKIQSKPLIQKLALLKLNKLASQQETEVISYGEDLLDQMKQVQYQLLYEGISYEA